MESAINNSFTVGKAGEEPGHPVTGGLDDVSGWWDVHTHRLDVDLRHAIWSCGWKNTESYVPDGGRRQENTSLAGELKQTSFCVDTAPFYISAGIHPWYLTEENLPGQWQWLTETIRDHRVVAIGEAGLDKSVEVSFELQLSVFRQVVDLADECGLPLIIHAVKASNEILEIKKKMQPHTPWIIHGFRGKKELAQAYLRQGIYLSFGARYQEEALRIVPPDYLFLETDESTACIRELYGRAAKIREFSDENLREKVLQNINKLFFRH